MLHEVYEIKETLKIDEGISISQEFKFLKDFNDRNIEVYTLVSTLIVGAISLIIGFGFKFNFERKVESIESSFATLSQQRVMDKERWDHDREMFYSEMYSEMSKAFVGISNAAIGNTDVVVFNRMVSVIFASKACMHLKEPSILIDSIESRLDNLLKYINIESLGRESVIMYREDITNTIIEVIPKKLRPLAMKLCVAYEDVIANIKAKEEANKLAP